VNTTITMLVSFVLVVAICALEVTGLHRHALRPTAKSSVVLLRATSTGTSAPPAPEEFLRQLLSSRTPLPKKKELLSSLQNLRVNMNVRTQTSYVEFLDALLLQVDSVEHNVWASRRLPVALPSLRLKLGSARRLLKLLENEEAKSVGAVALGAADDDAGPRRRRALAVLLGHLARQEGGVRGAEKEALKRTKRTSMQEMLTMRTPRDLETPRYTVVDPRRTWEVREYAPFSVCSTPMTDGTGFNSLAGYIFGKNQEGTAMKMTTPVMTTPLSAADSKKMAFIMPSSYWTSLDGAPSPLSESGVTLERNGGGLLAEDRNTVAVLWFGGYATKEEVALRTLELLTKLDEDDQWKSKPAADVRLLQYNDPFTPFYLRRNEVVIPVVRK